MRISSRDGYLYAGIFTIWLVYTLATVTRPYVASEALGLSHLQLVLLQLSVTLPYLAAWLSSVYAVLALLAASKSATEPGSSLAFRRLGYALVVFAVSLILTTLVGAVREFVIDPSIRAGLTIFTNYLYAWLPLLAFAFAHSGAGHLPRGNNASDVSVGLKALGWLFLLGFSVGYVWEVFTNPNRQAGADASVAATFYISDPAIALTIILPFLASCLFGLMSIFRLGRYYLNVTGYVYKQASRNLIIGLLFASGANMFLMGVLSIGTARLTNIGLVALLAIVYVLIGTQTLGKVFVAIGASKLAAIERVMEKYESQKS